MRIETDDPERCVSASVERLGDGFFCVRLIRADAQVVPIPCASAASAADLLREMNPENLLELLDELDAVKQTRTLH